MPDERLRAGLEAVSPRRMTPQKPSKVTTQPQVKNLSNTGSNVTILAIVAVIALVAGGALVLVRRRMN